MIRFGGAAVGHRNGAQEAPFEYIRKEGKTMNLRRLFYCHGANKLLSALVVLAAALINTPAQAQLRIALTSFLPTSPAFTQHRI